jgi:hypothetical protein
MVEPPPIETDAQGSAGTLLPLHRLGLKMRQGEKEGVAEREAVGLVDVDGERVVDVVGQRPVSASVSETTVWPPDSAPLPSIVVATVEPSEHAKGPMLCRPENNAPKAYAGKVVSVV